MKLKLLRGRKGSVLLETVVSIVIMTVVSLALIGMVQKAMIVSFKAREQMTCERMSQASFSRLKNIDFYFLFAADSSQANYGLWAAYPYKAALDGILGALRASKFDRLRVTVKFMRRDASDANADGLTSDLIEFADNNGDKIDDYDSNIKYYDQNADSDFYDAYTSGGRLVAEQPDTHMKRVTVDIFRGSRLACSHTELISLEQFTGAPNPSSEAALNLLVSTPTNNAYLYQALSAAQIAALALAIAKSYPPEIRQFRADTGGSLAIAGETDPLATVNFYVGGSGILASAAADASGVFSSNPPAVTAAFVEGENTLTAQAAKDGYISPITRRSLLLDIQAPVASGAVPAGTVNTLSPYVAVTLSDPGASTTTTSGICPDVITLKLNGQTANHQFNASAGAVVLIDSVTETVPVLSTGAYTAVVEAGDYAGYKTSAAWTFTVALPGTDHSAPSVANKSPIGMAPSQLPEISVRVFDNQTGIITSSILMKVDGSVVVSSANVASAYDPSDGTVSYTPPSPFNSGSDHTVEIQASHWATDPADKIASIDTWGFSVP